MQNDNLILRQNLYSARIFLNIFGLRLEDKIEANEIRIFDRNNFVVGTLYFEKEIVKIQCMTSLGNLNAFYNISNLEGFEDLECGGGFIDFSNNIKFQVKGLVNFIGDIQIALGMDTHFGNNYSIYSTIKYVDKDENLVKLNFMTDGKPFKYVARKEDFREVLEINPWNNFDSFMYHETRKGEYDSNNHCFPYERIKFVSSTRLNDEKHLRTVSKIIENSEIIEDETELYKRIGESYTVESTIQKGLLMQQIDPDFSKKIMELIDLFKNDNVSFLNNLIDVIFCKVSPEERKALFGIDIKKTNYYTNVSSLLDVDFGEKDNKFFLK